MQIDTFENRSLQASIQVRTMYRTRPRQFAIESQFNSAEIANNKTTQPKRPSSSVFAKQETEKLRVGKLEGEEPTPHIGLKQLDSESVNFDYHTKRHKLMSIVQDASRVIQGFE
jgi:hypothetical protein